MALISTAEAARRLNASADTIKLMCRDGRIAAIKAGGVYLIDDAILDSIKINPRGWPKGRPRKEP